MSFDAMRWAMGVHGVGMVPKMVLLVLADHANDDGRCWPSVARIGELGCLSERAVQGGIKALADAGLIRREAKRGGLTTYLLAVEQPPQEVREGEADPRTSCAPPPQQVRQTPAPRAPEPVREPVKEPVPSLRSGRAREADGSRLPDGWEPDAEGRAYATRYRLDAGTVAEDFRDYWHAKPGREGRKADWPATWRRWCRTEAKGRPGAPARASPPQQRRPATNGAIELALRAAERATSAPRVLHPSLPILPGGARHA